jgi:hypothetical protein
MVVETVVVGASVGWGISSMVEVGTALTPVSPAPPPTVSVTVEKETCGTVTV